MNLLFSIDRNCIDLLLNCMHSISENGGAETYDAYIFHSDLGSMDAERIKAFSPPSVRCFFLAVPEEMFSDFPETKRYPRQIYYRLAAAELLPKHLERILYLDIDTLVINDLRELYDTDFQGNLFVACTHTKKLLSRINQVRLDVEENVPYVNTGVLLMHLPLMRKEVKLEEIQAYAAEKKNTLLLPDQDILTALYGHRVKLADPLKYNLSDRDIDFYNADPMHRKIDLAWVRKNAVILHYYGRNKPWKESYHGILGVFYEQQKERRKLLRPDPAKEQLETLNQQMKELAGLYRKAVSRLGVSENELWVWYSLIVLKGDQTQQEICNLWSLSKQTVNTIINHMAQKGLVTLENVPGARNRKIIRLTPEGETYGKQIILPLSEAQLRAFTKLSPEVRTVFLQGMGQYLEALTEILSANSFPDH
ncbi:hypothetical protein H9X85_08140 [Anaerotignum lactatifermentans]|uniref:HTH marR-type domain-containing protein n=1 Tax=Anaerotignum lactatifermentans TaxID=160404 RepID=A0ABS2G938_9FIRM|nr:glycosyltransferase [Anaerotignum lactatifermentans]MBM6829497.1 hypothetical protein [Anaerotignum lactatifermentans]MBM6877991.1 hypothetical protein [Anaerotignum lactatifermentans]MBM6951178.1 hypothetical protein [Anaerotignum lactatifermentans]